MAARCTPYPIMPNLVTAENELVQLETNIKNQLFTKIEECIDNFVNYELTPEELISLAGTVYRIVDSLMACITSLSPKARFQMVKLFRIRLLHVNCIKSENYMFAQLTVMCGNAELYNHSRLYLLEMLKCSQHINHFTQLSCFWEIFNYLKSDDFGIWSANYMLLSDVCLNAQLNENKFIKKFQIEINKLITSSHFLASWHSLHLLGCLLDQPQNKRLREVYVNSIDNLKLIMNSMVKDKQRQVKVEALKLFKHFILNLNYPPEIKAVLKLNHDKIIQITEKYKDDTDKDLRIAVACIRNKLVGVERQSINCLPLAGGGMVRL